MTIVRDGNFTVVDYTGSINKIARVNHIITDLGLISNTSMLTGSIAQVERVTETSPLMKGTLSGGDRHYTGGPGAQVENFNIPIFSLDRKFSKGDIENFRKFGEANAPKTLQDEVVKAMAKARRSQSQTFNKALAEAIKGKSYGWADVGVAEYNYYTKWGVSQTTAPIDFTDATVHPAEVVESLATAHIIDNAGDNGESYSIIAICGRQWFDAFVSHNDIEVAYQYYNGAMNPLRDRLGGNSIVQTFEYKGVNYIKDISGNIPTGEAYFLPLGMDRMFEAFYAPLDDAAAQGEPAQEIYLLYKENTFDRQYKLECESNFLIVNNLPELVVKSVGTFA